jgi:hypothetical protein
VKGEPRSLTNTNGEDALDRVCARRAVLDPADVQHGAGEVDLVPAQVADLGRPEAMPEGEQDHGGVAVTVAVALGRLDQRRDFIERQMLPCAQVGVLGSLRRNCS